MLDHPIIAAVDAAGRALFDEAAPHLPEGAEYTRTIAASGICAELEVYFTAPGNRWGAVTLGRTGYTMRLWQRQEGGGPSDLIGAGVSTDLATACAQAMAVLT